ncbi:MAG: peptidoglycan-binding protein [Oscillospiraceae bacterium]|nr:peptidoglycan-binding protein [Oscillospiraceae bacterium]
MKKLISLILAALLALSTLTAAFAATYTDKDTVKQVQQALNDAGYNCGTPDGIAGKKTAAAITQYQTEKGLEATGTIDDALLEAMGLTEAQPDTEGQQAAEPQAEPEQTEATPVDEEAASQGTEANTDGSTAAENIEWFYDTWPGFFMFNYDFAQFYLLSDQYNGFPYHDYFASGSEAEILQTDSDGVYQFKREGDKSAMTFLFTRAGDDYSISEIVFTVSTNEEGFEQAPSRPAYMSSAFFCIAVLAYFNTYENGMGSYLEEKDRLDSGAIYSDLLTERVRQILEGVFDKDEGIEDDYQSRIVDGFQSKDYEGENFNMHIEYVEVDQSLVFTVKATERG